MLTYREVQFVKYCSGIKVTPTSLGVTCAKPPYKRTVPVTSGYWRYPLHLSIFNREFEFYQRESFCIGFRSTFIHK
jgi:hypothetical protein